MKNIGFIGCGNMGGAIASALAKDPDWNIHIHDARTEHAQEIAKKTGATACSLEALMESCDLVVLAVKPQVLPYLYPSLRKIGTIGKKWISLAAGVALETLEKELGSTQIVRIMPNIAAEVGKAVTAITPHLKADPALVVEVSTIARQFGTSYGISEEQLAAFIGVSGSAIATCFAFMHGIAMGGVDEGLPYPTALALIRDTMESATSLIRETGRNPIDLMTNVCSAGGTTIEAMKTLADGSLESTLMESVTASAEKAKALEEAAKNRN
jgi:pyrroline-5-carboxylate reductase